MPNDTPTVFTDEDLVELERWMENNPHKDDDGPSIRTAERLVKRLRAAEDAMSARGISAFRDKYEIWQKAAGKEISEGS